MSVEIDTSLICGKNISQSTQHGRFTTAVLSGNSKDFSLFHFKTDATDSFKLLCLCIFHAQKTLFDGVSLYAFITDLEILDSNCYFIHTFYSSLNDFDIGILATVNCAHTKDSQQNGYNKPRFQHMEARILAVHDDTTQIIDNAGDRVAV